MAEDRAIDNELRAERSIMAEILADLSEIDGAELATLQAEVEAALRAFRGKGRDSASDRIRELNQWPSLRHYSPHSGWAPWRTFVNRTNCFALSHAASIADAYLKEAPAARFKANGWSPKARCTAPATNLPTQLAHPLFATRQRLQQQRATCRCQLAERKNSDEYV